MDQLPLFEVPRGRAPDKTKTSELPLRPLKAEIGGSNPPRGTTLAHPLGGHAPK